MLIHMSDLSFNDAVKTTGLAWTGGNLTTIHFRVASYKVCIRVSSCFSHSLLGNFKTRQGFSFVVYRLLFKQGPFYLQILHFNQCSAETFHLNPKITLSLISQIVSNRFREDVKKREVGGIS